MLLLQKKILCTAQSFKVLSKLYISTTSKTPPHPTPNPTQPPRNGLMFHLDDFWVLCINLYGEPIFNKILNILIWESWGFESLYKNKIHSFLQSLIVVWFVFVTYAESQPTYQDLILFSSQQCAQICKDFSTKDVIFTSVFFLMFLLNRCESIPRESWKTNWK